MRVISFNINSIRKRMHQLIAIIDVFDPDVICLQETKVQDKDFDVLTVQNLGYHAVFYGQKTHYGVAILSKCAPMASQLGFGINSGDDSEQRRFIHARYHIDGINLDVLNGYFPQGQSIDTPKFDQKREFYARITDYAQNLRAQNRHVIIAGDMNIAPNDSDVGFDEKRAQDWRTRGICSFLDSERKWYARMADGFCDSYLLARDTLDDDKKTLAKSATLSWFDYRDNGFYLNPRQGLRIDHILASANLAKTVSGAGISYLIRAMNEPSDHAPIWADFDLSLLDKQKPDNLDNHHDTQNNDDRTQSAQENITSGQGQLW